MANIEPPITLEQQVVMMKKYVLFRQRKRMLEFLSYAGYFRASRYGKYLLSQVGAVGRKSKQDELFQLYEFDVNLRRILNFSIMSSLISAKSISLKKGSRCLLSTD